MDIVNIISSLIKQSWPPPSHFGVSDIPDLQGKVIIVTGGNTGLGKETVKALLSHNAKVYLAARSEAKAQAAIKELSEATGKEAIFLELDLSSLSSVRKAAEEFLSKENKLDTLFNNGGIMGTPLSDLSAEGYDLQFGTNVIGHFYLTKLLLPALTGAAKESPDGKARVVTTSSIGHMMTKAIDYDTLTDTPKRRKLETRQMYYQSKLGNIMVARELAKRYGDQGVVSTSCNPGNLRTGIQRNVQGLEKRFLFWLCYPGANLGALTQLWAGTSPETLDFNGKYLIPWARVGAASKASQNDEQCQKLWNWLEEQVENVSA